MSVENERRVKIYHFTPCKGETYSNAIQFI